MVGSFDTANLTELRSWLIRRLGPICDADPVVLTDYIVALLRHDATYEEARVSMAEQLADFLEDEAPAFVDQLLTTVQTKDYVADYVPIDEAALDSRINPDPLPLPAPAETGIPIPLDGIVPSTSTRGTKRSYEPDESPRPPPKGPRLTHPPPPIVFPSAPRSSHAGGHRDRDRPAPTGPTHALLNSSRGGPANGHTAGHSNGRAASAGPARGRGSAASSSQRGTPMRGRGGPSTNGSGEREICRDYHNHGYCSRGENCIYSHGDDAVVPAQMGYLQGGPSGMDFAPHMMGMPMPMIPPGFPIPWMMNQASMDMGGYDPNEARMDITSPTTSQQQFSRSTTAKDVTPSNHANPHILKTPPSTRDHASTSALTLEIANLRNQALARSSTPRDTPSMNNANSHVPNPVPSYLRDLGPSQPHPRNWSERGQWRGSNTQHPRGGRGRGNYRSDPPGTFDPAVANPFNNSPPSRHTSLEPQPMSEEASQIPFRTSGDDKTLVVERIPTEYLSLEAINGYFKKFGTVTNVAIDQRTSKALVSFVNHKDAFTAHRNEEAVFGNRFVRVYWHRPVSGRGMNGIKALAASAPLVKDISSSAKTTPTTSNTDLSSVGASQQQPEKPQQPSSTPTPVKTKETITLAAKTTTMDRLLKQSHALLKQIGEAKSAAEKKSFLTLMRKIDADMKATKALEVEIPSSVPKMIPEASTSASKEAQGPSWEERQAQKRKDMLDRDLELQVPKPNAATEDEENPAALPDLGDENMSREELLARMEALQQQAANLSQGLSPARAGYQRGARGTRRPRGAFYPRGGPAGRVNLTLDNRSRNLLAKGVNEENAQIVKAWFEEGGDMDSFQPGSNGEVVVSFNSRVGAEQALAKVANFTGADGVQVSWYTATRPTVTSPPKEDPPPAQSVDSSLASPDNSINSFAQEEVAASESIVDENTSRSFEEEERGGGEVVVVHQKPEVHHNPSHGEDDDVHGGGWDEGYDQ